MDKCELESKKFYNSVYEPGHPSNYGGDERNWADRISEQKILLSNFIKQQKISPDSRILEIGCGMGYLFDIHPNWTGVEYSSSAVKIIQDKLGKNSKVIEGDATCLQFPDNHFQLVYSFAALEHVPDIEKAFKEISRVTAPQGIALLAPAWNCRPWTVKKLQLRPYTELRLYDIIEKMLIPLRENILWRAIMSLPGRLYREALLLFKKNNLGLHYKRLFPDFSLNEHYPHISDDDAFVSLDAHAALMWYLSRGWKCLSHSNFLKRILMRGEHIILKKS